MTPREIRAVIARADARLEPHSDTLAIATAIVVGVVLAVVAFALIAGSQAGVLL
jgi:hypothetical protein